MHKDEFVEKVANCAEVTKLQARRSIDCYHKLITGVMKGGDNFIIRGFGTFSPSIVMGVKTGIQFKASKTLSRSVGIKQISSRKGKKLSGIKTKHSRIKK